MRFSKAVTEYLYGVSLIKLKFLNKYRDKLLIVLFSRLYIEHSLHKRERINCCDDRSNFSKLKINFDKTIETFYNCIQLKKTKKKTKLD